MKEALMEQITKILASVHDTAAGAALAIKAGVPELCRQIVAWELWRNVTYGIVWLCVTLAFALAGLKAARWAIKSTERDWNVLFPGILVIAAVMAALLMVPIGTAALFGHVTAVIKCLTAPDLVVLDCVKSVIAAMKQ